MVRGYSPNWDLSRIFHIHLSAISLGAIIQFGDGQGARDK